MWHFALDVKDADNQDRSKLAKAGINVDHSFGRKTIEEFKSQYPRWNDSTSEAYGEVDFLEDLVFYKVDSPEPAETSQAIKFVTEQCFWAPMLITHGGELISIDDHADDSQFRISDPG